MYADRLLAAGSRLRTARAPGIDAVLDAWSGTSLDRRAAFCAAQGDVARAAAHAAGGWAKLLAGEVGEALDIARKAPGAPGMGLLEAEALIAAGAIVAGLEVLEALHREGEPEGTLGLVRRRHQLGDHRGAMRAAQAMPWHAGAALAGARAALMIDEPGIALRLVEPYLQGLAPLPEPAVAAALAVTTASVLARFGEHAQLRAFAGRLLNAGDLMEEMSPSVARAAWIAGLAAEAWRAFDAAGSDGADTPWRAAARLELAVLAGDAHLAARLLQRAGPLGGPAAPALGLLRGGPEAPADGTPFLTDRAREVFVEGRTVHVWRTHPHRWRPWIEAALRTPAEVVVCDLAAGDLPDPETLPGAVMDDGTLVEELAPVPTPVARTGGAGVDVAARLCQGVGVGRDWPAAETEAVRAAVPAPSGEAAVRVVGADAALAEAATGRPAVVVAPPGDPFWAGPLPESVWPAMRIVRHAAQGGWSDAGARVVAAARELLGEHAGPGTAAGAAREGADGVQ